MAKVINGLFLFHRDLRIYDNVGLREASKDCYKLYTAFIFTPEQVSKANPFKSTNSIQFMIESLESLVHQISSHEGNLILMYGPTTSMIKHLLQTLDIQCLYFNRDYTPYAIKRDQSLKDLCAKLGIGCKMFEDYYVREPGTIRNQSDGFFHKFTPFYEKMISADEFSKIAKVSNSSSIPKNFAKKSSSAKLDYLVTLAEIEDRFIKKKSPDILVKGGREAGLKQLHVALKALNHYGETRDIMSLDTSHLSAYLKYGCVSIREAFWGFYKKYGKNNEFLRQLIWRDFFAHILFGYPKTLTEMHSPKFDDIKWSKNEKWLHAWKMGKTGFPAVDASMRQLNATGYMHNRGRMLVANFLVKVLLLDWREGEKYFAQLLVDYDVASNSGNWQAIVGGGVYASAWFRTMSPWIQSAKFDHESLFVKTWILELRDVPARDIHKWNLVCDKPEYKDHAYPKPICDFTKQGEKMMQLYRKGT